MAEGLRIVVGADVKEAEAALKGFVDTAKSSGEAAGSALGKGLNKSIPVFSNIPKQIKPARVAISHLGEDLETLQAKLGAKKSFLNTAKTSNEIVVLKGQIVELENEIKRVQNLGVPTMNSLSGAVTKTGLSFQSVAAGANNAFGVIRKIAFIIPGIGIAGIFGALFSLFDGIGSKGDEAAKSVDKVSEEVDHATKKQEEFSKAIDKAAGSVLDQAAKLQDLRAILLSTSIATAQLTSETIRTGVARALFDQKNVALQGILNSAIQKEINLRKINRPFSQVGAFRNNPEIDAINKEIKSRQALGVSVVDLEKKKKEIQAQTGLEFSSQDDLDSINALSDGLGDLFKKFLDEKGDAKKGTDDIIAQAKRLASFLDKNTQFQVKFEVDETISEDANKKAAAEFIAKAKSFIEKQTPEFKFKPLLRVEFKFIQDGKFLQLIRDQAGIEATKTYKEVKKEFEDNIKRIAENNPIIIETNAKIQAGIKHEDLQNSQLASGLGLRIPGINEADSALTEIQKQAITTAQTINGILTPAFDGLFSAIKAGENPVKAFFTGIGQALEQLIQKLVAAAVQALVLSAIFPGGIGAGASAVKGFGGFFKNILGFASGGIVSGPTLSLIGEGRGTSSSNPEVVAPLDRLRGMLAGISTNDQQVVVVGGSVRGNRLQLLASRTERQNGRLRARR